MSVDGKWESWVDASAKSGHVVIDIQLQNGHVGGLDVCNKIPEGEHVESFYGVVESFYGVIEGGVVYAIDGHCKLVACDGGYNKVGVPRLLFGKVGGTCLFGGRSGGGSIDGILGGSCCRDVECCPIVLKVENRVPKGKEWP